jgi:hypothetical protein
MAVPFRAIHPRNSPQKPGGPAQLPELVQDDQQLRAHPELRFSWTLGRSAIRPAVHGRATAQRLTDNSAPAAPVAADQRINCRHQSVPVHRYFGLTDL